MHRSTDPEHAEGPQTSRERRFRARCYLSRHGLCGRSRAFWPSRSGRRRELDVVAARDLSADSGDSLGAAFGRGPHVIHQRFEHPPRTTGHRCATIAARRATQDRPPPGPSPPPAMHTRPCGAGPSCVPGLPEGGACGYFRTRAGAPGSRRPRRWRRRPTPAGPHRGRCCSWGAAARGARPARRAPDHGRYPTGSPGSPWPGPRPSASSSSPRPYLAWTTDNRVREASGHPSLSETADQSRGSGPLQRPMPMTLSTSQGVDAGGL